ncbi:MAG: class I SAM-dependent methyltransferase [Candidatus Moraniibacteriota bacterium]
MSNNKQLVQYLVESGAIKSKKVKEAFLKVDRGYFVPERWQAYAYEDYPLEIAQGQTISQPTTVAFMLELLEVEEGDKILDIGAGSGWVSCLLAFLSGRNGEVDAFEINKSIGDFGREAVLKAGFENVNYTIGNAAKFWNKKKKYNKIYSGAAFEEIPLKLKESLLNEGVLVSPSQDNCIRKIIRKKSSFAEEVYPGFVFVPFLEDS